MADTWGKNGADIITFEQQLYLNIFELLSQAALPPRLHKQGVFKRPWLPFGEYLASKQKGGEAYAKPPGRNYVWPRA